MIVSIPDSILTTTTKPVIKIDKQILDIITKLKKTLLNAQNPKGVGLAAPQIGAPFRIFITKPTPASKINVFINPKIIWKSSQLENIDRPNQEDKSIQKKRKLEGCLSIPNVWGHLKRANKLRLRYQDSQGNLKEEEFEGFMATIIQHESDHLDGILFTQRVLEQKEKLYRIEKNAQDQEKLVEIEI